MATGIFQIIPARGKKYKPYD